MSLPPEPSDTAAAEAERLFVVAAALTAQRLDGIAPPRGYIGEMRHLQPTYKAAVVELTQAASPSPRVSPSLKLDLAEHFRRLGTFDISLAWDTGTAYGELRALRRSVTVCSIRDTCICEMPSRSPISRCVRSSWNLRRRSSRSGSSRSAARAGRPAGARD